ncbi:hypothetical protein [Hyphomicrobium sp.]|jgi:hypothetical protein|uniref:hypothetical protein n=1 Tax=Hyphomicrobium sp. TaxID=82 RepID=UPI003567A8EE
MASNTQTADKPNRPPYRVLCHVGQVDRKFWEQNGVGFPHKKTEGGIVFTPPFDIKAGTPCMIALNSKNDEASEDTANDEPFA